MDKKVLVNTCVWASFFAKPDSIEKRAVDDLLDSARVVLVGPIVAEVLTGFRRPDQAAWVASRLRMANYIEATWEDWRVAADIGRELAAKGWRLPLTDLVVAAVARRHETLIYTTDPLST